MNSQNSKKHFRGSLPPLRSFHFKSSIVTVPFFHCTLYSVKVPLSSRQVCISEVLCRQCGVFSSNLPLWHSIVALHKDQGSIVPLPGLHLRGLLRSLLHIFHCESSIAVSKFHSSTARFAFQRFSAATARFPFENLPLWRSHSSTAPCAVSKFQFPLLGLHFKGLSGPLLQIFHCDSSIVALHLVQCQGCIVLLPGFHFRGLLEPLHVWQSIVPLHPVRSWVSVQFLSQCTPCGLKVCLWLRGSCLRGLPGDCLHGLLHALRGYCFYGFHGTAKARSQQRNGLDIALVGLRGDCLGDFTSHLQRKDALASLASNRAFVSNAFT